MFSVLVNEWDVLTGRSYRAQRKADVGDIAEDDASRIIGYYVTSLKAPRPAQADDAHLIMDLGFRV